jgi:WD40 repeat protein
VRDDFPRSEAHLSLLEETLPTPIAGPDPDVPEHDRLIVEKVLGTGGMGRVLLARDLRLNRLVAVKEVIPSQDDAGLRNRSALEARLAREAWITSLLEHPGILPIYDIGTHPDGTLYYTMPLVQGESFAVAIARHEPKQRMTLLRRLLEACEAVAAAHRRGIIHRDLKPENIMLVEGGGTRVVDWGLACLESEGDALRSGVLGTPGYMSPEQHQGRPVGKSSDVWSLGVILKELLIGRHTGSTTTGRQQSRAIEGAVFKNLPPELCAILRRALAELPGERYPDAEAMAEDLVRYLDGRRVEAHEYSARELTIRFFKTWRVPLIVAGVALIAIWVVIAISLLRLSEERDRALEAERLTARALGTADEGLSRALASQARLHAEREAIPEAEILAAHALRNSESPVARGVLFGTSAESRPTRVYSAPVSKCLEADFDDAREVFACRTDESVELWQVEPTRRLWRLPVKARGVGVTATHVHFFTERRFVASVSREDGKMQMERPVSCGRNLLTTDARLVITDSACVWTPTDLASGGADDFRPCSPKSYMSVLTLSGDGRAWAAGCSNGYIVVGRFGDELLRDYEVPYSNPHIVMALAFGRAGELVLGTNRGDVRRLDLERGTSHLAMRTGLQQVERLKVSPSGLVLASSEFGSSVVMNVEAQRRRITLTSGTRAALDWMGERIIEIKDGELAIWDLPTPRLSSLNLGDGVTSVDFDTFGERVVVTHADGVGVWQMRNGEALLDMRGLGVVKAGIFSEDDGVIHLSSSNEEPGVREINLEFGADITSPMEYSRRPGRRKHDGRRILKLWNDWYVTLSYSCGVGLHPAEPVALEAPVPCVIPSRDVSGQMTPGGLDSHFSRFIDGATNGHEVLLLEQTRSSVWWLSPELLWLERLFDEPGATAISSASDGRTIALAVPLGVVMRDAFTGEVLRFFAVMSSVSDVAIAPDGRRVAAGGADGTLWVWDADTGVLVAQLDAHRERISALKFSGDGRWLVSGGWDGLVRIYDTASLSQGRAGLAEELEREWGLSLEEIQGQGDGEP